MTNINIIVSSFICHSVMWENLPKHCLFDFFCQTEGISMLRNELIHKEMFKCSQTSKSKEQKHKIILNIAFILRHNSS